ncbi:MAG TPA: CmpA/NrtA family ABC transporter substrate-binding protein [Aliidongia sp.]|nr:CmpA/NrtA family ABC transporter substrate-binding protein [Aliidongia sp.]
MNEPRLVRIGLLRLTDAAPMVLAKSAGLFAAEGLDVVLQTEPSWANLADKLAYGLLDAAVMLPPLALAMALGLRVPATPLIVPMSLSLNGNSVTLSNALAAPVLAGGKPAPLEGGRRLRRALGGKRPVFATVHSWSTHNLLLRYWLAASGFDPEHDIAWTVVPPSDMVEALASGRIDGFCAGAPWGEMAARAGVGRTVILSSEIWRDHPEKCLAVHAGWAETQPRALQALLSALLRAAMLFELPDTARSLAELLAGPDYVDVPADAVLASLPGGQGGEVDRSVFAPGLATHPWPAHARWFLRQMARRGDAIPAAIEETVSAVYRPDLHARAAERVGLAPPDRMIVGPFCDGAPFES